MKKVNSLVILALWAAIAMFAWFSPAKELSDTERRPLAQKPEISVSSLLNGKFMTDFEDYTLDQFPLRDGVRTLKSLFHYYILGQKDNNGIYLHNGYAAKQEYPLDESSLSHALERFTHLYKTYLAESDIYMAVIPDKGYYLAEESGHLSMDYGKLFSFFAEGMPWAAQIVLTDQLAYESYYRTDTHWQQQSLLGAAAKICEEMGITGPGNLESYRQTWLEQPFYGVYYGQAALPMEPDRICLLESELLDNCTVYDHETGKTAEIYDKTKLNSKDLYEVFLSGPKSLLTISNPAGNPGKELIVFRDSFGSAMIPLILQEYETITVIDIRYIQSTLLDRFVDFHGQDVLLLYSTLVLNNSGTIK